MRRMRNTYKVVIRNCFGDLGTAEILTLGVILKKQDTVFGVERSVILLQKLLYFVSMLYWKTPTTVVIIIFSKRSGSYNKLAERFESVSCSGLRFSVPLWDVLFFLMSDH